MKVIITAIALIFSAIGPTFSESGDKAWLDWFKPVNAHLRTVVVYLGTDNLDLAALSLEEFMANEPPAALVGVLASAATSALSEANAALNQIDDGDGPAARNRLLELRQAFFDINRKNNIEVFDDCIWEARKAALPLWHYRRNKPDFTDAKQREEVLAATYNYLNHLEICGAEAPDDIRADKEWSRVSLGAISSLHRIKTEAIPNNDVGQFIRFIRELRSFDNLLYFRYG